LKVTYCEPAIKGDTVSGGGKPATVETGMIVTVPYHVKLDDVLKIDTRTGEYVEKIK
jgi:elongation factor P